MISAAAHKIRDPFFFTPAILALATLLVFISAWAGQPGFLENGQTYLESRSVIVPGGQALVGQVPLGELLFFLQWIGIILFLTLVRNSGLTILGVTERPFLKALRFTMLSVLPMILIGGLIAIVYRLWWIVPAESAADVSTVQLVRGFATAALVLCGWLGEGWFTVRNYSEAYPIRKSGAIGLFLAPWAILLLIPIQQILARVTESG